MLDLLEQVSQVVLCAFWELNLNPLEEQAAISSAPFTQLPIPSFEVESQVAQAAPELLPPSP